MNQYDAVRRCQLEDYLRQEEGSSVMLVCNNPDPDDENKNIKVVINSAWTDWKDKDFYAVDLLTALELAAAANEAATGTVVPVSNAMYAAETPKIEHLEKQLRMQTDRADRFCAAINAIARLFWGDNKQCYAPEAVVRQVAVLHNVDFQHNVRKWTVTCFGQVIADDPIERFHRFMEEAFELGQACGCTREVAQQLLDYVFSRPIGNPSQEAGGVMITLAALCDVMGISMLTAGDMELNRNWQRIDSIRAKRANKPAHSPLP